MGATSLETGALGYELKQGNNVQRNKRSRKWARGEWGEKRRKTDQDNRQGRTAYS